MKMTSKIIDYRKFVDLENYLFNEVSSRFLKRGYLEAFDFHLILIWKSNRSKKLNASKVIKKCPDNSYEEGIMALTRAIYITKSDIDKVKTLFEWEFRMATASAILTVLYPKKFTVYDYRVREDPELKSFKNIDTIKNLERRAERYLSFVKQVNQKDYGLEITTLREKDKYLWGRSFYNQVEKEIKDWNNFKGKKI